MVENAGQFKRIEEFDLFDVETVKLILRGESVVDWHRLNLATEQRAVELLEAMEYHPAEPADRARLDKVKYEAISFLRRHFDFPIPKPVERASVEELMLIASGKGHRQPCACTILKAMHIVHHVECRELAFSLPLSKVMLLTKLSGRDSTVIASASSVSSAVKFSILLSSASWIALSY